MPRTPLALFAALLCLLIPAPSALAAAAKVTVATPAATAASGAKVRIAGQVANGTVGQTVTLMARTEGQAWKSAGTAKLAASNAFAFTPAVALGTTQFRVDARRKGAVAAGKSRVVRVKGRVALTPPEAIAGERVKLAGILPTARRRVVTLQRRQGSKWVKVAASNSTAKGAVSFAFTPSAKTSLRFTAPAAGGARAFTTASVVLAVVPQTAALTLPKEMCAGADTTASAVVAPVRKGRSALLEVSSDNGKTWKPLGTAGAQDAAGKVKLVFKAPAVGQYQFRVSVRKLGAAKAFASKGKPGVTSGCGLIPEPLPFVAVGANHSCMIDTSHVTWCWGDNAAGELGDTTTTARPKRVPVAGGLTFVTLALGESHSCGLVADGTAYCWGENGEAGSGSGAVGDGTAVNRSAPSAVLGNHKFVSIAAGQHHTCGIAVGTGLTYCWGANASGQLGTGEPVNQGGAHDKLVPALVAGGILFDQVFVGQSRSCALTKAGKAYCWGDNFSGLPSEFSINTPQLVPGGLTFTSLALGDYNNCGLTAAGSVFCWGLESRGTFGDGGPDGPFALSPVPGPVGPYASIGLGRSGCGLTAAGAASCWGDDVFGGVGDGAPTEQRDAPTPVTGGHVFSQLAVNYGHACGVVGTSVLCWGNNTRASSATASWTSTPTPSPPRSCSRSRASSARSRAPSMRGV